MNDLVGRDLVIICNGCGKPMRNMGEWPCQYPKDDLPKNIVQAIRYSCKTCRLPAPDFKPGYQVGIAIVGTES